MPSTTYIVQAGDTLGKIAKKFYGDASRFPLIVAANSIADPDRLSVGQALIIPDAALVSVSPPPAAPAAANPMALLSQRRLAQVHPLLADRGQRMLDLCTQAGIAVLVTQGLRSWQEQDRLYAKGRTTPPIGEKYIVTKAKGGQSYHNFGLAFDIVVLDAIGKENWDASHPSWLQAVGFGKSVGLEWGGDWKTFKDRPHFQYTGGITLARCRQLFPQGLPAIWAEVT